MEAAHAALGFRVYLAGASGTSLAADLPSPASRDARPDPLDTQLEISLRKAGFTGRIESTLVARLDDAVRHPLDVLASARSYRPAPGRRGT